MNEKELLKEAVAEAVDKDMENIPADDRLKTMHSFPKGYEKRLKRAEKKSFTIGRRLQTAVNVFAACAAVFIIGGVSLAVPMLFIGGMGASSSASKESYNYMSKDEGREDYKVELYSDVTNSANGAGLSQNMISVQDTTQKIIYTVDLNIETKEFDDMLAKLMTVTTELGGYTEGSGVDGVSYNSEYGHRGASFTMRIPSSKLDAYLDKLDNLGNVTSQYMESKNVTLEYINTKSRKEALEIEYDRVLELLKQADSVETILALESHLSELRASIGTYDQELRVYDDKVNYSTVNIYVREVNRVTPQKDRSVTGRIKSGFSENMSELKEGIVNFFVEVVIALPYIVFWGVIVIAVVIVIRVIHRNKKRM